MGLNLKFLLKCLMYCDISHFRLSNVVLISNVCRWRQNDEISLTDISWPPRLGLAASPQNNNNNNNANNLFHFFLIVVFNFSYRIWYNFKVLTENIIPTSIFFNWSRYLLHILILSGSFTLQYCFRILSLFNLSYFLSLSNIVICLVALLPAMFLFQLWVILSPNYLRQPLFS
jgi:hypothetical protein